MSTALEPRTEAAAILEALIAEGDLSKMSREQRLAYYGKLCKSLGLNSLTRPFEYVYFESGKLTLYARKDCTEQLRQIHGVSITDVSTSQVGDLFVATAKARCPVNLRFMVPQASPLENTREDVDSGVVSTKGLSGPLLANAMKKAITQAKRRVTLSICGLGILDESEVPDTHGARVASVDPETGELEEPPPPAAWELTVNEYVEKFDQAKTREEAEEVRLRWTGRPKEETPEAGRAVVQAALDRARKRLPGRTP